MASCVAFGSPTNVVPWVVHPTSCSSCPETRSTDCRPRRPHSWPSRNSLKPHKTYEKLRRRYYWRDFSLDEDHWCRSCVNCAMRKRPSHKIHAPPLPIPVDGASDRVAVHCLGTFPVTHSGNHCIAGFSDYYWRWPETFAVPSIDAATIARLLVDELRRDGALRTLLSHRGSNVLSKLVSGVCRIMNTRILNTSTYHPQSDGLVERFNGTLAQSLSMYVSSDQKDWDQHISQVLYA